MSAILTSANFPKDLLMGLTLPKTGWTITQQMTTGGTGGNFGTAYLAEKTDEKGQKKTAFVKALDFVEALSDPAPLLKLQLLVNLATFENDIHEFCQQSKMTKVIAYVGQDEIIPPVFGNDLMRRVFCIILEQGEGDLRKKLTKVGNTSLHWKLTILRDVAKAIEELHKGELAHLDIKPSNVITLPDSDGDPSAKIGDLGRVVRKSGGPYNQANWPGDRQYQPIERFYGYRPSEWIDERESADAFLLGSLFLFLFTGATMNSALMARIPKAQQPGPWTGGFNSTLVAVLIQAHAEVIEKDLRPALPDTYASEICRIAFELTYPVPEKRGDRRARGLGQVGMDRIWNRIRLLAQKAKLGKL